MLFLPPRDILSLAKALIKQANRAIVYRLLRASYATALTT